MFYIHTCSSQEVTTPMIWEGWCPQCRKSSGGVNIEIDHGHCMNSTRLVPYDEIASITVCQPKTTSEIGLL